MARLYATAKLAIGPDTFDELPIPLQGRILCVREALWPVLSHHAAVCKHLLEGV